MVDILLKAAFCLGLVASGTCMSQNSLASTVSDSDTTLLDGLVKKITSIEAVYGRELNQLKDELILQRHTTDVVKAENERLRHELDELRALVEDGCGDKHDENNPSQGSQVKKIRRDPVTPSAGALNDIAFTSRLQHHARSLGENDTVIFDTLVTNVGNAYDVTSGVFTAPLDGTYVFSYTLVAMNRNNTHAALMHNDEAMTKMFVDGFDNRFDSASHTVALRLKHGDEVTVRNLDDSKSIAGGGNSLFTGFLLTQEYHEVQLVG